MRNSSVLFLLAVLVAAPARAQTTPSTGSRLQVSAHGAVSARVTVRARATADSAQKLEAEGKAPEAIKLLRREKGTCTLGDEGRTCRQILDYSLGYVLERSSAGSQDPGALLRQAAASYEKVLGETPTHGPTLANLADIWQRLGEPQRAEPFLERAMAADPASAGVYALRLGDLRLQGGDPRAARQVYSEILAQDPDNMVACNRLVMSHELAPDPGSAQALLGWSERWDRPVPEAARDGYEAIIRIAHRSDAATAETALVRWVDVQGRTEGLSSYDLERLPATWESPAFRDLQAWLKRPEEPLPRESWWRQEDERSQALARAALALGRSEEGRGAPEKAAAIWGFGRELAGASEALRIDLQTELALLFFHHPELDPDGTKFRATEGELFDAKTAAIQRADLATIQRYHESLGLIYAERGNWGSRGNARSALFQLQNALDTAAERERVENLYQPLPFLRERLADGYLATAAPERAVSVYLDACRAYLDVDDVRKAETMLATARRLASSEARDTSAEIARLAEIVSLRRRLAEAVEEPAGDRPLPRAALERIEQSDWLSPLPAPSQKSFGARQRFKAFADLAVLASRGGAAPDLALRQAVQAMDLALQRQAYLVGAGDLLRLEHVQTIYTAPLGLTPAKPQLLPANSKADDALPIALPSGDEPAFVRVSPESAVAAHIVRDLGADAILAARPQILIRGRNVLLREAEPGTDVTGLLTRMKKVEGVDDAALTTPPG